MSDGSRVDHSAKAFLGRGWSFPVGVEVATGRIALSEYERDVHEAIGIILLTDPGERVMRPDFGAGLRDFVMRPMDRASLSMLETRVRDALTRYEPRIEIVELLARPAEGVEGKLEVRLTYRVRATNNEFNWVYPYYLQEGSGP